MIELSLPVALALRQAALHVAHRGVGDWPQQDANALAVGIVELNSFIDRASVDAESQENNQ